MAPSAGSRSLVQKHHLQPGDEDRRDVFVVFDIGHLLHLPPCRDKQDELG